MTISLPLPSSKLSPNARCHWRVKSVLTKAHRFRAKVATLNLTNSLREPHSFTKYTLTFYWPNAIRRDDDNAAASCKAYRDGIADGLRMDDHGLTQATTPIMLVDKANPRLEITLLP